MGHLVLQRDGTVIPQQVVGVHPQQGKDRSCNRGGEGAEQEKGKEDTFGHKRTSPCCLYD